METKKYIVTFVSAKGKLVLEYASRGAIWVLVRYECQAELTDEQHLWWAKRFPMLEVDIEFVKTQAKGRVNFALMPADLSFETFYKKYNDTMGKKKVAAKMWEGWNESQRIAAHTHHDNKYLPYLKANPSQAKKHINTYFNWLKENEVV